MARMRQDLATAKRRVMGAAARATQTALRVATDRGYDERIDVQGKPYLRPKDGHMPPMERTRTLRRAYRYPIIEGAVLWLVKIIERTPYGQYLRDRTPKMDARQHIPKPDEAPPQRYDAAIRSGIDAAVRRVGGAA